MSKSSTDVFMSPFPNDIYKQKYSMDGQETWADTCKRVINSVCGQLLDTKTKDKLYQFMFDRKFIPGGRYLYSSGRSFHQVNNCFLFRAEDSREGWADATQKAISALMSGGGIGFDYSALRPEGARIGRTGGTSTGPISLMKIINESGRQIMQGGARRSAIWSGLLWSHPDTKKFIHIKDHNKSLKEMKAKDFNFELPMELTNISVNYDTEFFIAIEDEQHPKHQLAKEIWKDNCKQAFSSAEPGMAFNFRKDAESLRNACVTGDTKILTEDGYKDIESLVGQIVKVWNGFEYSEVEPKVTGVNQPILSVNFSDGRVLNCTPYHKFHISTDYHGGTKVVEAKDLESGMKLIKHKFPIIEHGDNNEYAYNQGFISAEGMDNYKTFWVYEPKYICLNRLKGQLQGKEYISNTGTKRKSFKFDGEAFPKTFIPFTWNIKSKLDWLAGLFDGDGTELKEGGLQISSVDRKFLADTQELLSTLGVQAKLLNGNPVRQTLMPDGKGGKRMFDCQASFRLCLGAVQMQDLKSLGLKCERMSFDKKPNRDASQFITVTDVTENGVAEQVFCFNEPKRHMAIFNGVLTGQCTEVTSEEDSDKCNLGTVWMNRCKDKKEFAEVVKLSTFFLLCGGIYSDVPTEKIKQIGTKNNRIGLGLGGIHEWLMLRGQKYEVVPELHKWLAIYRDESDGAAFVGAKQLNVSVPKGIRAIAPNGSIGILAETTTGIEPLFCKAYKRRYFKEGKWLSQLVVDGAVKRLLNQGVKIEDMQDAYDLNFRQRVKFQADVQNYVDMAISSTCNMPSWGSELNNEKTVDKNADILLKYAKRLRGFTVYPDGCRGGQPLTPVDLKEALADEGKVFEENEKDCLNGVCGI